MSALAKMKFEVAHSKVNELEVRVSNEGCLHLDGKACFDHRFVCVSLLGGVRSYWRKKSLFASCLHGGICCRWQCFDARF